jgi:DNA-binding XRE family transcriptional regulator
MERNYIKEYRILRGIKTQAEFARIAGVARSTLGEIERHKMRGDTKTLNKIAIALGITREQLYVRPEIKAF